MCTSIAVFQGGGLFGRNLDLEYSFGESVVITPRDFPLSFRRQPEQRRHMAMIGMAHTAGGFPLYAEAVNEKGLYMAGLNFPVSAYYPAEADGEGDAVAPYELIPWLLGSCGSLAQAKEQLARFRPLGEPFSEGLPLAPLHWHIADKTGAAVLEATRDGVFLYDDPICVLTNEPPFPFHLSNLAQYRGLSPRQTENRIASDICLDAFGQGFGAIGLPGDSSPASRYVRAAFYKLNSPDPQESEARVTQFFHLLESVAMVKGGVVTPEGRYDITTYSCCFCTDTQTYYYKTYDNSRINAVRLNKESAEGAQLLVFRLDDRPDFLFRN